MTTNARPARRGPLAATAYAVVYLACLAALWRYEGRRPAEAIAVLVIMGGVFPSLAWLTTRGAIPHPVPVRFPARELQVVLALLVAVAAFLTVGTAPVRSLFDDPTAAGLADLAVGLLLFVALPALVVRAACGYGWRELFVDPAGSWRGHRRALVVLSLSLVAMQLVLGRGAARIREAGMTVVVMSVAGLFLGTLWARTRNLPLVVVVHAATDLVPQLVDVSRTLRLL
jgi:membrane protease YdiL (CAAX protease family)